jgi:acyl-CoA synthetase (NDP forming)
LKKESLDYFFYPESIAVVGASSDPSKAGYQVLKNLTSMGFAGKVFPVNPRVDELFGLKCFKDIQEIPDKLDLLVITVPAKHVLPIVEQAVQRKDVKAIVCVSAGFSETKTDEGKAMEEKLVAYAKQAGIRVFGPNCTGVINTDIHLDTTIEPTVEQVKGGISVFSQSGAMAGAIILFMEDQPTALGFNKWAHVGNMCDVNLLDVLEYYGSDDSTKVICIYMEGLSDGRGLIHTAKKVSKDKVILALKVGRNEMGAKAAFSHTGSLAGKDEVYEAAFRKSGIIRVNDLIEMVDTAKAFSMQPLPTNNKICILTEAGGPGSMAMDEIGKLNGELRLAHISEEGKQKLKSILPDMALVCEPDGYIDMTAAAMEQQHADALEIVLNEEDVDAVVLITVPPTFLPPCNIASELLARNYKTNKPIMTCFLAGKWVRDARKMLEIAGWPTFDTAEQAVKALQRMWQRTKFLKDSEE